jgi:hypothetical protein
MERLPEPKTVTMETLRKSETHNRIHSGSTLDISFPGLGSDSDTEVSGSQNTSQRFRDGRWKSVERDHLVSWHMITITELWRAHQYSIA